MSADSGSRAAPLLVERDGAVETLSINDAPRNRMSLDFMDALEAEVARVADDPGVRAIVIRGSGEEHFSVGMDLKQLPQGIARMGSVEAVFDQRLRVLDGLPRKEKAPFQSGIVSHRWLATGGFQWKSKADAIAVPFATRRRVSRS